MYIAVHVVCVCASVTSALLILVCKFAYTHQRLSIYTHGGRIIMFVFTLNCYTRRIQSIYYTRNMYVLRHCAATVLTYQLLYKYM